MESILLLCITIFYALSQKDGSNYPEIEQLDEMVTKKYAKVQESTPPPTNNIPPMGQSTPSMNSPLSGNHVKPPMSNGFDKPPSFANTPNPQKTPTSLNKTTTKSEDISEFSLDGFDFEKVLSSTIDENAFKELEKQR